MCSLLRYCLHFCGKSTNLSQYKSRTPQKPKDDNIINAHTLHLPSQFIPKIAANRIILVQCLVFPTLCILHCCSECLCRIIITISYYALILNTSNLHGDPFLNCFLSAMTEVPAYIIALLLLQHCSRHFCQSSTLLLGGVMILCVHLIPIGNADKPEM